MFKMGCSMARKILTIDKATTSGSGSCSASGGSGGETGKKEKESKKGKDKQQQQKNVNFNESNSRNANSNSGNKTGDELNDFSKLQEDSRIPLNVREIFKITKSWKAIARTMSKTGTAMFLNLFEQNQDLFYLFDRFQHLKGKELHDSMELKEHAATVMSTLDQSINFLSDYDNFVRYLHSIGKLHKKVPGFRKEHFWKIEQPFLKAVKQTLDERCNESIEKIYIIAIKLIIETISDGYGDDEAAPDATDGPSRTGGGAASGDGGNNREAGDGQQKFNRDNRGPSNDGSSYSARKNNDKSDFNQSGARQEAGPDSFGGVDFETADTWNNWLSKVSDLFSSSTMEPLDKRRGARSEATLILKQLTLILLEVYAKRNKLSPSPGLDIHNRFPEAAPGAKFVNNADSADKLKCPFSSNDETRSEPGGERSIALHGKLSLKLGSSSNNSSFAVTKCPIRRLNGLNLAQSH